MSICSELIATPIEVSGSMPDEESVNPREAIIPDPAINARVLERLIEKKKYWGFLEGKDALLYLRLLNLAERPMSKLSSLLPGDPQLERRARKLEWQTSNGSHVTCEWDNIFLSELTPEENRMSDEDFMVLYPDQVKSVRKRGGRPRKYLTIKDQRKGHAERQRRYRARKHPVIEDVTKIPLQLAEI